MKIDKKTQINILNCLEFVKQAVIDKDNDMLRSYYEQLNDLIVSLELE